MVLTEAFAAGTPVVASDIAGYRDVVRHGGDGLLFTRGDSMALAGTLRELACDPARLQALSRNAAQAAERFAWPRVAAQLVGAYEDAIAAPAPVGSLRRFGHKHGLVPADGKPRVPASRLPTLEPARPDARRPQATVVRRVGVVAAVAGGVGLSLLALQRIGVGSITDALWRSSPTWVVAGLALMCLSMIVRSVAWRAILRAALPNVRVGRRDVLRGTSIGVLMSATLPARLGEPARALAVARRVDALAYGIVLQAAEVAAAIVLGVPALIKEGMSWKDVRLRVASSGADRGRGQGPFRVLPDGASHGRKARSKA